MIHSFDSFHGNQDVELAGQSSNTATWGGSQEGQETLVFQSDAGPLSDNSAV